MEIEASEIEASEIEPSTMRVVWKQLKAPRKALCALLASDVRSLRALACTSRAGCDCAAARALEGPPTPARWALLLCPDARSLHPTTLRRQRKRALGADAAKQAGGHSRCMHYIARKQRYCAMERVAGAEFCGAHLPAANPVAAAAAATVAVAMAPDVSSAAGGAGSHRGDKKTRSMLRMPCPVDPSHTIFVRNLASHIKICTRAQQQAAMEQLPFFVRGINGGAATGADGGGAGGGVAVPSADSIQYAAAAAAALQPRYGKHHQEGASGDGRGEGVDIDALITRVRALAAKHAADFPPPYRTLEGAGGSSGGVGQDSAMARTADAVAAALREGARREVTGVRHGSKQDKHAVQQAGIVAHMARRGLVRPSGGPAAAAAAAAALQAAATAGYALESTAADTTDTFIEYGAGRGMLALAIRRAQPSANIVLVERMSTRGKADRVLREGSGSGSHGPGRMDGSTSTAAVLATAAAAAPTEGEFFRAGVDIRDLDVSKLPFVGTQVGGGGVSGGGGGGVGRGGGTARAVGVAKHLCGLATDLTLRSFLTTGAGAPGVHGAAIATCCHHRCSWDDYVARNFFEARGFDRHEFELLMHWTGWVSSFSALERSKHAGKGASKGCGAQVLPPQPSTLRSKHLRTTADQAVLGRQCKRLVDLGRMQFLRELGFRTELVHYCPEEVSLENALIIAWREN